MIKLGIYSLFFTFDVFLLQQKQVCVFAAKSLRDGGTGMGADSLRRCCDAAGPLLLDTGLERERRCVCVSALRLGCPLSSLDPMSNSMLALSVFHFPVHTISFSQQKVSQ